MAAGRFDASRYLAGLAVKCAIKALLAGQTEEHEFPDKQKAIDAQQDNLEKLLDLAGLSDPLTSEVAINQVFKDNRGTIRKWKVEWRYDLSISESDAAIFFQSTTDPANGVLTWLRARWQEYRPTRR